jgi:hypothetical protein
MTRVLGAALLGALFGLLGSSACCPNPTPPEDGTYVSPAPTPDDGYTAAVSPGTVTERYTRNGKAYVLTYSLTLIDSGL